MEEYKNGLTSETITEWINSDIELHNCIIGIENSYQSYDEQAEAAFYKISELFNVPKNPEDIIDDDGNVDYVEQTSVYEQLGLLKYLNAEDGIRGIVLTAIYFVKNGYVVDFEFVINKFNTTSTEKVIGIGFKGENTKVEIVFIKQGESWFDMGCKLFNRIE